MDDEQDLDGPVRGCVYTVAILVFVFSIAGAVGLMAKLLMGWV